MTNWTTDLSLHSQDNIKKVQKKIIVWNGIRDRDINLFLSSTLPSWIFN